MVPAIIASTCNYYYHLLLSFIIIIYYYNFKLIYYKKKGTNLVISADVTENFKQSYYSQSLELLESRDVMDYWTSRLATCYL